MAIGEQYGTCKGTEKVMHFAAKLVEDKNTACVAEKMKSTDPACEHIRL